MNKQSHLPTALITGANRGIGLALVHTLLSEYQIIATSRTANPDLEQMPVTYIPGIDVCNQDDVNRLVQMTNKTPIHLLCHVAGCLSDECIHDYNEGASQRILDQFNLNALAPIRLTAQLLTQLPLGAKVIMITSRMGSIEDNTSGGRLGYRMSKAALNIASKSLSIDLKDQGVSVGIIHPGYVQTRMVNFSGHLSAKESAQLISQRIRELTLESSGCFVHANGDLLPW